MKHLKSKGHHRCHSIFVINTPASSVNGQTDTSDSDNRRTENDANGCSPMNISECDAQGDGRDPTLEEVDALHLLPHPSEFDLLCMSSLPACSLLVEREH